MLLEEVEQEALHGLLVGVNIWKCNLERNLVILIKRCMLVNSAIPLTGKVLSSTN